MLGYAEGSLHIGADLDSIDNEGRGIIYHPKKIFTLNLKSEEWQLYQKFFKRKAELTLIDRKTKMTPSELINMLTSEFKITTRYNNRGELVSFNSGRDTAKDLIWDIMQNPKKYM